MFLFFSKILSDGASSRQRRKSNSGITTSSGTITKKISKFVFTEKTFRLKRLNSFHDFFSETKRRDTIKVGLEDLQRVLPQFGTPEEEKVFCNSVFFKHTYYLFFIYLFILDQPSHDIVRGSQIS